jgi:hypothetical protein
MVAIGLVPLLECLRQLFVTYYTCETGLFRQKLFGSDELRWQDIEAVGTREVQSRYGLVEGIIVHVHGMHQSFRMMQRPKYAAQFLKLLNIRCPTVLRIDQEHGIINAPRGGKSEQTNERISRYAHRLRLEHTISIYLCLLVFSPLIFVLHCDFASGTVGRNGAIAALVSAVFFMAFASSHWQALRNLKRRGFNR